MMYTNIKNDTPNPAPSGADKTRIARAEAKRARKARRKEGGTILRRLAAGIGNAVWAKTQTEKKEKEEKGKKAWFRGLNPAKARHIAGLSSREKERTLARWWAAEKKRKEVEKRTAK